MAGGWICRTIGDDGYRLADAALCDPPAPGLPSFPDNSCGTDAESADRDDACDPDADGALAGGPDDACFPDPDSVDDGDPDDAEDDACCPDLDGGCGPGEACDLNDACGAEEADAGGAEEPADAWGRYCVGGAGACGAA
jgi:hypothetical protein